MITELRNCPKCRRLTIQVISKVLTYEEVIMVAQWMKWKEEQGKSLTYEEMKAGDEAHSISVAYCPHCGNHWREEEIPSKKVITRIASERIKKFLD